MSERDVLDLIRDLRVLAVESSPPHDYAGACPTGCDPEARSTDRDNTCPACAVLMRADSLLAAPAKAAASAEIETPEAMVSRLAPAYVWVGDIVRARDEQIAAWCEGKAQEANTEPMQGCWLPGSGGARVARGICVGAATSYRAVVAALRGSR